MLVKFRNARYINVQRAFALLVVMLLRRTFVTKSRLRKGLTTTRQSFGM